MTAQPAVVQTALQLAIEHYGAGRHAEAEAVCRQILELAPAQPDALNLLGLTFCARGNPLLGLSYIDQAIDAAPHQSAFYGNRGEVLRRWGMLDAAVASLQRALEIDPDSAQAHNNLGLVLLTQGKPAEAAGLFERALEVNPAMVEAHYSLGGALKGLGEWERSAQCFSRAIELNPQYAEALYELGCVYAQLGEPGLSANYCLRALEVRPNFPEAEAILGNAFLERGDYAQATAIYRRVVASNPHLPAARYQLSLALLREGDFAGGWPLFESRYDAALPGAVNVPLLPMPMWRGEDLTAKSLLVLTEQGYGDHIQFCRFIRPLAGRGVRIVMGASAPMLDLMRTLPGCAALVGTVDEAWSSGCDYWTFVGSLPYRLGVDADNIPADTPYLYADPARSAVWQTHLAPWHGAMKIGLFWAGRPTHAHDSRRSLKLAQLAPLAGAADAVFFGLQQDERADEAAPPGMTFVPCRQDLNDFADTAALISELDLLISVDSAPAHLAGAMRRPVWTLLPFRADWRWQIGRDDTPWYPGMRLFRQPAPGNWDDVVERVCSELNALVLAPRS